jgi:hypothetical protein
MSKGLDSTSGLDQQESNIVDETETCVGVRSVLSYPTDTRCNGNLNLKFTRTNERVLQ